MCAGLNSSVSILASRFAWLRERKDKALILFLTAGDQPLDELPELLATLEQGGADVIEVGIPFSDPFGEGPTIQASSQRSLDRGTTPVAILAAIERSSVAVPVVTMGYYNPVLRMGLSRFAEASRDAGVSGTIVSDLIPDEASDWCDASARAGLDTIFLAAPTSTPERISEVAHRSTGFVYAVSRTGVTGAENQVPTDVASLVDRIRRETALPICVGFGISKPEHVRLVCQVADGAVVGSALVDLLYKVWDSGRGKPQVLDFVRTLKAATS
jgi:tryptophan synthase alpha chain